MSHDAGRFARVKGYLDGRYARESLTRQQVARELLCSVSLVHLLLASGELEGCRICDVAHYIVKKEREDG